MRWGSKKQINQISAIPNRAIGESWELYAQQYLIAQGLIFVDKNYHCRQGEIDLIMKDDNSLIFIEVKFRKNNHFGGAISAVTHNKQQKIIKTATFYLQQHQLNEYNTACRFDVIAIEGDIKHPKINWLKNAF